MPNTSQAKKRLRQDAKRQDLNKSAKSSMRTAIKKVLAAETAEDANAALPNAMKRIDKASKRNVIHDNTASRYKARLHRSIKTKG